MSSVRSDFWINHPACSFPVASAVAKTLLSLSLARFDSVSLARRSRHRCAPDRIDGTSSPALDLMREALSEFAEHIVAQLDQVKSVGRNAVRGSHVPKGLAERLGRVDGNDLHTEAPLKRSGEQPVPTPSQS